MAVSTAKPPDHPAPQLPAGLVSCLAFTPEHGGLAAAGAYSGCAALFDEGTQEMLFVLSGHKGGITQVGARHSKRAADC